MHDGGFEYLFFFTDFVDKEIMLIAVGKFYLQ